MSNTTWSKHYKIVMLGGGGVGKSALSIMFIQQHFLEYYDPTIEDSYRKQVSINGDVVLVEVLDTAGQEEFKSMREQWIRQGDGFFIVFSITSRNSLSEINGIRIVIERTREKIIQSVPCLLFGNKADLDSLREIGPEEATDTANTLSCRYFEGSAKTNLNLEEAYFSLIRNIRDHPSRAGGSLPYGQKKSRRCVIL